MGKWLKRNIKTTWQFMQGQSGSLEQAAWALGIVVVCVAVILAIKAIAPGTATSLWNTIWDWVQTQFSFS